MRQASAVIAAIFVCIIMNSAAPAEAGWTLNGAPVCTAGGEQHQPRACPDGMGGAIIAWMDIRSTAHIYAQRLDEMGRAQWALNGVIVCGAANGQAHPQIVSDGAGGAIIVWEDFRANGDYDVYAQRIDPDGAAIWTADGVAVCIVAGYQVMPQICADGAGGCIVAWEDRRGGANSDIYAQRVDSHGVPRWTAGGIVVCDEDSLQWDPRIVSDGDGGAEIVWSDYRTNGDLYAQRLDGDGNGLWAPGGVPVCDNTAVPYEHEICTDGAGGVFVTWYERRPANFDIFIQRIDASGNEVFAPCGVALCTMGETQRDPAITADGAGGAIVAWEDFRAGSSNSDLYAQRVNSSGVLQWTETQGEPVCTFPNSIYYVTLLPDGEGGAIIAWADARNAGLTNYDVYCQHIDRHGDPAWTEGGEVISEVPGSEADLSIISDGAGGAIVAWRDSRNPDYDIYAQRILDDGTFTATMLESYTAVFEEDAVALTWRVAEEDPDLRWIVSRKDLRTKGVDDVDAGSIEREGREYTLVDRGFERGAVLIYSIEAADEDGRTLLFETDPIEIPAATLRLLGNHPNPFNPSTTIRYEIPARCRVALGVYDVGGRLVARLVDGMQDAGVHEVRWDGLDTAGGPVASGVYFSRLSAGKQSVTGTMVLLR